MGRVDGLVLAFEAGGDQRRKRCGWVAVQCRVRRHEKQPERAGKRNVNGPGDHRFAEEKEVGES